MNNFRKLDRLIRPFLRADRFMLAKVLMVLAIIVMAPGGLSRAQAAELVMFESTACTWCAAWHNEVGVIYDKTPESKVLPLRRVDVDGERPADLGHLGGIRFTPTFVILEDGAEIGRILGYPGEDFFWQLLGEIVKKVESKHANKS